ncbi:MAG: baseplate J/gp47 family protein [Alphaproteobacteria bacterium]|nr:baseplate J/gp47 family protein [Alphaproteobacteria bacterium]
MIDLDTLPPPAIVEALSYEAILAAYKALAAERLAAVLPDWNPDLESDVIVMVLEACAYRELTLRARVNDAARASLLAFAAGADLDHLAAFYGVARLPAESDTALRDRIREHIVGWSTAGGAAHYRYHTLSVPGVHDAAVFSPEPGRVRVAVMGATGDGTPTPELLAAVAARVGADDVRVLTDHVEIVPVQVLPLHVVANVWLTLDAPAETGAGLATRLTTALAAETSLGWNVTRSWLTSVLHPPGVQRVELSSPESDLIIAPDQVAALTSVAITIAGRDR